MDTRKRRKELLDKSASLESIAECPKRARIHAQRKFAQGSQPSSPAPTPIKDVRELRDRSVSTDTTKSRSNGHGYQNVAEMVEIPHRPNTEDFLTFLCCRGTSLLRPELESFSVPQLPQLRSHDDYSVEKPKITKRKDSAQFESRSQEFMKELVKKNLDQTVSHTSSIRVTRSGTHSAPLVCADFAGAVRKRAIERKVVLPKFQKSIMDKESGRNEVSRSRAALQAGIFRVSAATVLARKKSKAAKLTSLRSKTTLGPHRVIATKKLSPAKPELRITRSQGDISDTVSPTGLVVKEKTFRKDTEKSPRKESDRAPRKESEKSPRKDDYKASKKEGDQLNRKEYEWSPRKEEEKTTRKISQKSPRKDVEKEQLKKSVPEEPKRSTRSVRSVHHDTKGKMLIIKKVTETNKEKHKARQDQEDPIVKRLRSNDFPFTPHKVEPTTPSPKTPWEGRESPKRVKNADKKSLEVSAPQFRMDEIAPEVRTRPSRRSKEAASVYLELIGRKLARQDAKGHQNDSNSDDDDYNISTIFDMKNLARTNAQNFPMKKSTSSFHVNEEELSMETHMSARQSTSQASSPRSERVPQSTPHIGSKRGGSTTTPEKTHFRRSRDSVSESDTGRSGGEETSSSPTLLRLRPFFGDIRLGTGKGKGPEEGSTGLDGMSGVISEESKTGHAPPLFTSSVSGVLGCNRKQRKPSCSPRDRSHLDEVLRNAAMNFSADTARPLLPVNKSDVCTPFVSTSSGTNVCTQQIGKTSLPTRNENLSKTYPNSPNLSGAKKGVASKKLNDVLRNLQQKVSSPNLSLTGLLPAVDGEPPISDRQVSCVVVQPSVGGSECVRTSVTSHSSCVVACHTLTSTQNSLSTLHSFNGAHNHIIGPYSDHSHIIGTVADHSHLIGTLTAPMFDVGVTPLTGNVGLVMPTVGMTANTGDVWTPAPPACAINTVSLPEHLVGLKGIQSPVSGHSGLSVPGTMVPIAAVTPFKIGDQVANRLLAKNLHIAPKLHKGVSSTVGSVHRQSPKPVQIAPKPSPSTTTNSPQNGSTRANQIIPGLMPHMQTIPQVMQALSPQVQTIAGLAQPIHGMMQTLPLQGLPQTLHSLPTLTQSVHGIQGLPQTMQSLQSISAFSQMKAVITQALAVNSSHFNSPFTSHSSPDKLITQPMFVTTSMPSGIPTGYTMTQGHLPSGIGAMARVLTPTMLGKVAVKPQSQILVAPRAPVSTVTLTSTTPTIQTLDTMSPMVMTPHNTPDQQYVSVNMMSVPTNEMTNSYLVSPNVMPFSNSNSYVGASDYVQTDIGCMEGSPVELHKVDSLEIENPPIGSLNVAQIFSGKVNPTELKSVQPIQVIQKPNKDFKPKSNNGFKQKSNTDLKQKKINTDMTVKNLQGLVSNTNAIKITRIPPGESLQTFRSKNSGNFRPSPVIESVTITTLSGGNKTKKLIPVASKFVLPRESKATDSMSVKQEIQLSTAVSIRRKSGETYDMSSPVKSHKNIVDSNMGQNVDQGDKNSKNTKTITINKSAIVRKSILRREHGAKSGKGAGAFSPLHESSVYAFEPDVESCTLEMSFSQRLKSAPSTSGNATAESSPDLIARKSRKNSSELVKKKSVIKRADVNIPNISSSNSCDDQIHSKHSTTSVCLKNLCALPIANVAAEIINSACEAKNSSGTKKIVPTTSIAIQCDIDEEDVTEEAALAPNESGTQTESSGNTKYPLPPSASPFYYLPLAMAALGEKLPAQLVQQMLAKTHGLVGAAEAGMILQQAAELAQQHQEGQDMPTTGASGLKRTSTVKPIKASAEALALAAAVVGKAGSSGVKKLIAREGTNKVSLKSTSQTNQKILEIAKEYVAENSIEGNEPLVLSRLQNLQVCKDSKQMKVGDTQLHSIKTDSSQQTRQKNNRNQDKFNINEDKTAASQRIEFDQCEVTDICLFTSVPCASHRRRSNRATTLASTKATESDMMESQVQRQHRKARRSATSLSMEEGWSSSSEAPMSPQFSPESARGWTPLRKSSPTPSLSSEGTCSSTPSSRSKRLTASRGRRNSLANKSDRNSKFGSNRSLTPIPPPPAFDCSLTDPSARHLCDISSLTRAPSFFPTEEEFTDPLDYIEKIRPEAEHFGICRIVPPGNFKPECRVNDDMRFAAYNQYIHKMMDRWGPNVRTLQAIRKCLKKQNIELTSNPMLGGMELDLVQLYNMVEKNGGLGNVLEKELWDKVADGCRIPKLAQDRLTKLDAIYCKFLLPYSTLSPGEREKLLLDVDEVHESGGPQNSSSDDDDEYEESMDCVVKGKSISLSGFYRVARNTAARWQPDPAGLDAEERYWSLVEYRKHHVCVHSASIDTSEHGYGFSNQKNSPLARHAWNLKNLCQNPNSVLRSMGSTIGVTAPTLHVGMLFSCGCWYRDPHGLPWIEYMHTGTSKIWYGVAASQEDNLHRAFKKIVPDFVKDSPVWLPSDTAMVPPSKLSQEGAKVCRVVQEPGQFVVVFPAAFVSNLCTSYVVSESAFFARPPYFDRALALFEALRQSNEPSMFSLERLVISVAKDSKASLDSLLRARPILVHVLDNEKLQRAKLQHMGLTANERLSLAELQKKKKGRFADEDENNCEICKHNLYVSMVSYSKNEVMYCLEHAVNFIKENATQVKFCRLKYSHSVAELKAALEHMDEVIHEKVNSKSPSTKNKFEDADSCSSASVESGNS